MANRLLALLATLSSLILISCGGGGGSNAALGLSGKVIDGYVSGAKVCLDINSNNMCDAGDPTTTTDANGNYTLPPYSGNTAGIQIIAEVPVGANDLSSGIVTQAYSLFAPAASPSPSVVVTPLTTLVSSQMIANQVSATVAETTVKANLNISTPLTGYDYIKAADTSTTTLAAAITTAIATGIATASGNSTVQTANLTSGQIVNQVIQQVQTNVLPQVITSTGTLSSTANVVAVTTTTINGSINNIVVGSISGTGTIVSLADVFKNTGIASVDHENNFYYYLDNVNQTGRVDVNTRTPKVSFIKFDIATATNFTEKFKQVYIGGKWVTPYDRGEDWYFDKASNTWVPGGGVLTGKPTINQNCIDVPQISTGGVVETYCAVSRDLSTKLISSLVPNLCFDSNQQPILNCDTTATFPPNSIVYDFTASVADDEYDFYVSNDLVNGWNGYQIGFGQTATQPSDIYTFIDFTKTQAQYLGDNCNTSYKVFSYDPLTKMGVMLWDTNTNGCGSPNSSFADPTKTTNFTMVTLGDRDILKLETSSLYRANNPGDNDLYTIFGYVKNAYHEGIWSGDFKPKNSKKAITFNGDFFGEGQIVSPVVLDAVLAQKGLAPFPYP